MSTFPQKCPDAGTGLPHVDVFGELTGYGNTPTSVADSIAQIQQMMERNEADTNAVIGALSGSVNAVMRAIATDLATIDIALLRGVNRSIGTNTRTLDGIDSDITAGIHHAVADVAISLAAIESQLHAAMPQVPSASVPMEWPNGPVVPSPLAGSVPYDQHAELERLLDQVTAPAPSGPAGPLAIPQVISPTATVVTVPGVDGEPTVNITINMTVPQSNILCDTAAKSSYTSDSDMMIDDGFVDIEYTDYLPNLGTPFGSE